MRARSLLGAMLACACGSCAAEPAIPLAIPMTSETSTPVASSAPEPRRRKPPQATDPELRKWAGLWVIPSTAYKTCVTIDVSSGAPTVTAAVEAIGDKEAYEVKSSTWQDGTLSWSHYVPSTTYLVVYVCTSTDSGVLRCTWSNNHSASGKDDLSRVESLDAVDDGDP